LSFVTLRRYIKERIRFEHENNPKDEDSSEPPNITPQDLKKILQQRQEKDFKRVDSRRTPTGRGGERGGAW
jgi:hypothetical protein